MYNNPYGDPYQNSNNDKNDHTNHNPPQKDEGNYQNYSSSEPQTTQTGGYTQSKNSYDTGSAPSGSQTNPQGGYSSTGGGSYIWTSGTATTAGDTGNGTSAPAYYPPQPPQKRKGKSVKQRTGLKIIAALMCCLIISVSSVGAFALMIQYGVVDINSGSDSGNAAFTINRVVKDETTNMKNINSEISELTPQQVAQKLIPSVVCIQTYNTTQNQQYMFGGYGGYGEYDDSEDFGSESLYSQGSGIIYTADGYIITNAHVISGATNIKVVTSDGLTYEAEVIGSDESTDLAVIKIDADGLTSAEFGSSEDLQVADEVMAIGNPGGIEFNSTVTMGYVSALDRQVESDTSSGYSLACIQTDAAINPGNSGGALVNMYGQVVGINSSKIVAEGYEGLGFAIPVDTAQPIITDLMQHGYVKDRAMLGISGQYIDSMTAKFYGMTSGLYVTALNTQEAMNSGLQQADVITAVDGTQVTSLSVVEQYLVNKNPGDTVELTVSRASTGETLTFSLQLSENTGS